MGKTWVVIKKGGSEMGIGKYPDRPGPPKINFSVHQDHLV